MHHTEITKSTISISEHSESSSQMYSNRLLSKSFVIEPSAISNIKHQQDAIGSDKDKDVNGFFRRLLNRSSIKKIKTPDEYQSPVLLNTIVPAPDAVQPKPKPLAKPDKPKSGPASRQRVLPREILGSPTKTNDPLPVLGVNTTSDNSAKTSIDIAEPFQVSSKKPVDPLPPKPVAAPRVFEHRPARSSSNSKLAFTSGAVARVSSEYQIKLQDEPKSPYIHHRSDEQLFPRFFKHTQFQDSQNIRIIQSSQSTNQVGRSTESINETKTATSTPTRKPVEKSKSFRFYTESSADSSLHCSVGHMPSLPDLSFTSESSSTTTNTNTDSPNHRDLINKFEINDNNLVIPANKTAKLDLTGSRKTVFVTTSCESNDLMNKSPSRLASSTVIKLPTTDPKLVPSSSNSNINQIEDNIDRIMKFACVTVLKTPISVSLPSREDPPSRPTLPYSRSLSIDDDSKERRFSNESVEIAERLDTETTSTIGVIVERRKSVSDEKLKFERKIQERYRTSGVNESESDSRKSSLSEAEGVVVAGPTVVLRKKSNVAYGVRPVTTVGTMSTNNNGDDQTPELMKVFARRSLKLKDQDDYVVCLDDPPKVAAKSSTDTQPTDVVPKSNTESSSTPITSVSRCVTKTVPLSITTTPMTTMNSVTPLVTRLNGGYHPPHAHSGSISTTTMNHSQTNKTVSSALLKASSLITQTQSVGNNNNPNIHHNQSLASKTNISNNNNNNDVAVGKSVPTIKTTDDEVNENNEVASIRMADEFKGILQRRAEWEKRATQTFK